MIWESWPWKQRLLKDADLIERWARKNPSDRRAFIIEQKVFVGAYAMRKLLESQKLSSSFNDRMVNCDVYPALGKPITIANNHKFDKLYDFSSPVRRMIAAKTLLNLVIHSFIFAEVVDSDDLSTQAFFITSDHSRNKGLWRIELTTFSELMREVGNDMPTYYVRSFDTKEGDWFVWQGHGQPPIHIRKKLAELKKGASGA